jgi:glucosamine 6-phosphate synthetase-like amidotransferase/phosphosugar isomerase protein
MCGIFGYSIGGNVSRFQRGILASALARFNDERGGHSWGIVGQTRNGIVIHRGMGDALGN